MKAKGSTDNSGILTLSPKIEPLNKRKKQNLIHNDFKTKYNKC